jgi:hypothetical protein
METGAGKGVNAANQDIKELSKRVLDCFEDEKIEELLSKKYILYSRSVCTYKLLCKIYDRNKHSINDDDDFQSEYCLFYGLNTAHLNREFKRQYFKLMTDEKTNELGIIQVIDKIKNFKDSRDSYWFSFATKLMHTVDNKKSKPIWDGNVRKATGINPPNKNQPENAYKKCYENLENLYTLLLDKELVKNAINTFRSKFNVYDEKEVTNVKVLDFILWGIGKNIRKKS